MSGSRFNLSALAVRERSITLFLIVLVTIAGIYAFFGLGRAEDPPFTVKQMTVITVWPAHRAGNSGSGRRAAGKTPAGTQMV
jgi:multidrug efflux pump subunit AcrB